MAAAGTREIPPIADGYEKIAFHGVRSQHRLHNMIKCPINHKYMT